MINMYVSVLISNLNHRKALLNHVETLYFITHANAMTGKLVMATRTIEMNMYCLGHFIDIL